MSNVKIKKNINKEQYNHTVLEDDFNYTNLDVYFGFFHEDYNTVVNEYNIIEFNTLRFGCDLIDSNKTVLQSKSYPDSNINMFKTPSEYLQNMRFNVEPATTYNIKLWCNNVGIHTEYEITITTPGIPDYRAQFEATHPGETYDF